MHLDWPGRAAWTQRPRAHDSPWTWPASKARKEASSGRTRH